MDQRLSSSYQGLRTGQAVNVFVKGFENFRAIGFELIENPKKSKRMYIPKNDFVDLHNIDQTDPNPADFFAQFDQ